jgi:hypothetical protein
MAVAQLGPFGSGFLDPAFPEVALARIDQWLDRVGRMSLGDRDQDNVGG